MGSSLAPGRADDFVAVRFPHRFMPPHGAREFFCGGSVVGGGGNAVVSFGANDQSMVTGEGEVGVIDQIIYGGDISNPSIAAQFKLVKFGLSDQPPTLITAADFNGAPCYSIGSKAGTVQLPNTGIAVPALTTPTLFSMQVNYWIEVPPRTFTTAVGIQNNNLLIWMYFHGWTWNEGDE